MTKILFVCVENAGRSQMAEAFTNHLAGDRLKAYSAGTAPSDEVNPVVVEVMQEKGIDISRNEPKPLTEEMIQKADKIVVMGCGAEWSCPAPLLERVSDWNLEDPKDKPIENVRQIRDEIEERVRKLIDETT